MSNGGIIPKERLSAYQRWELASFDQAAARTSVQLPTAADVERVHAQAREEGFAAGWEEGLKQAREQANRIQALASSLEAELKALDQKIAQDLLALALEVAKQILRQALQIRPELVLPVVREAIQCLPQFGHHAHLVLHPDDAALVRSHLGGALEHAGWKIFEDPSLERGGCRVESPSTQVDATLETRWQRVLASLAESSRWLE